MCADACHSGSAVLLGRLVCVASNAYIHTVGVHSKFTFLLNVVIMRLSTSTSAPSSATSLRGPRMRLNAPNVTKVCFHGFFVLAQTWQLTLEHSKLLLCVSQVRATPLCPM